MQNVLDKCLSTLKRSGKPEERQDAIALMDKLKVEFGATRDDDAVETSRQETQTFDESVLGHRISQDPACHEQRSQCNHE